MAAVKSCCVRRRMRQYPDENLEDVREERDSDDGCNSREKMGGEPRSLPMELRETIKQHSTTSRATRDGQLGGSSSFAAGWLDELLRERTAGVLGTLLQVTFE